MSAPLCLATIGSWRPGALLVDVELRDERGERAVLAAWALTPAEAAMNAEDYCDERLGAEWAMNDWRALR